MTEFPPPIVDLVEGSACGGEGAGGVGQDPAHLLCHPLVECITHVFHIYLIALSLDCTFRRHQGSSYIRFTNILQSFMYLA